jgi:hypothetical protein
MTLTERQKNLIKKIVSIKDEDIIALLEEDIPNYTHNLMDITTGLSDEEINDLVTIANEPSEKDSVTFSDFREITQQWRTK